MTKWTVVSASLMAIAIMLFGCTGGGDSPVSPSTDNLPGDTLTRASSQAAPVLWGVYDCEIDLETETVICNPNRNAMFAANVVTFLNGNPANLAFHINKTVPAADWVDVDITVDITHPFPGMSQYNGYDVRGILLTDGTDKLDYNADLRYPSELYDQFMMADPNDPFGNAFGAPDGYTRWYNMKEFYNQGLFGHTTGLYETSGYNASATLCPYKYFTDDIGSSDFMWPSLTASQNKRGVFSAGSTNSRNYFIRFPNYKGIRYGYSVVANWVSETEHPANAPEAIAVEMDITDDVWYLDAEFSGGEIIFDVKIWDWETEVNSVGMMEDYRLFVESNVTSQIYEFTDLEMVPVDEGAYWYQYHVEIAADAVEDVDWNEFWLIAEYPYYSYGNIFGVPNSCGSDMLSSFFRFDIVTSPVPINEEPVCDLVLDVDNPMPFASFNPAAVRFDATGTYDPDPKDILLYEWDFNGNDIYNEPGDSFLGPDNNPYHLYYEDFTGTVHLRVTDGNTGQSNCSVDVDVTVHPAKNIDLRPGVVATDIAVDHTNGDLLVAFDDMYVYKYTRASFYTSGTLFINAGGTYPIVPDSIDITPNQYTMVTGILWNLYASSTIYTPSGFRLYTPYWLTYQSTICDAVAMGSNGDYADDLCFAYGYTQGGIKHNIVRRYISPYYSSYALHEYSFTGTNYFGEDKIYYDWIVGAESDRDDDLIWFLEIEDYYASRWELTPSPFDLVYDNAYFGTGEQTDDDEGFYSPKDITRDDLNRLFVLDELSNGDASVKMWTVDGDVCTSEGSFDDTNYIGDTGCIDGAPLRIEGSDFDGYIVVLHGDSAPYMLSVFHPVEMYEVD